MRKCELVYGFCAAFPTCVHRVIRFDEHYMHRKNTRGESFIIIYGGNMPVHLPQTSDI